MLLDNNHDVMCFEIQVGVFSKNGKVRKFFLRPLRIRMQIMPVKQWRDRDGAYKRFFIKEDAAFQ